MPDHTETVLLLEAFGNAGEVLVDAIRAEGFGVLVATHQDIYDGYSPRLKGKVGVPIIVDYSDPDVRQQLAAEARSHRVVGVMTGWEFFSGLCSQVAAALGLPGNTPALSAAARNKWTMAQVFHLAGVRHAVTVHADDAEGLRRQIEKMDMSYPVVVKPVENAGSVGVTLVNDPDQLPAAVAAAQALGEEFPHGIPLDTSVLAQSYIGGHEFSVESVAVDGEIQHLAITEKATTDGSYRAETGHTIPAELPEDDADALTSAATAALQALGFTNGAAHTEIKLDNGSAWVIEAALRPAGDHIVRLVTLATGIDFARAYVRAVTNAALPGPGPRLAHAGVRFLVPQRVGTVAVARAEGPVPAGVIERQVLVGADDRIGGVTDNVTRLGYVIATGPDRPQLEHRLEEGLGTLRVV
ncbi:MAG: ATP-grasp domain-containing protein, partial [Nocardioides sp.]